LAELKYHDLERKALVCLRDLKLGAKVLARVESGACSCKLRSCTEYYSKADDKTPIDYVYNLEASFDHHMGITDFGDSNS